MVEKLHDLDGVAALAGITPGSARTYHDRATRNRREGDPRPGDLPEPDYRFGRGKVPVWTDKTVRRWLDNRPRAGKEVG